MESYRLQVSFRPVSLPSFIMCENCKKSQVQRIIEGFGNYVFRTPETETKAKRRVEICAVCLQINKVRNEFCPECHCFIPAKIRSMAEQCPKKLW